MSTALQAAMDGQKLSETQQKGALGQAIDKITGLKNRVEKGREIMESTATEVIHLAEEGGSLFLTGLAEGYFGEEKLKPVYGVDIRPVGGGLAIGFGLYQVMNGNASAGRHFISIGKGVAASWLAGKAVAAGRKLAEKSPADAAKDGSAPANPQIAPPAPDTTVQGAHRDVLLTPVPTNANRFRRARAA